MRVAAIETSGDWCSAALWTGGEVAALERRAPNRHSELALPMLERLLAAAGLSAAALDAVAFGAGPGSFTGLRIACGLAQGLALARELPVLGISSFEAIAEESGAGRVVVCIDARMKEVYYAALERDERGRWREVVPAQCVSPDQAPPPPGEDWVGCGSGFAAYPDFLSRHVGLRVPQAHASAAAVASLAGPRLAAGEGVDAALALPTYLRDKVAFTQRELQARSA
ncbi:MAG TPA: tRNA (adenosine(37)-N6)-threonylcarbamoyltransferase complex dimerization subunit type 1 TsaB [Burkholderiales bacterium]|nr:tRNA (adenosine(37)-N6)-threonylcarbamoyltransferase complex dimerization subunit type 1 TsaB [Burkholderiales bacterium]